MATIETTINDFESTIPPEYSEQNRLAILNKRAEHGSTIARELLDLRRRIEVLEKQG